MNLCSRSECPASERRKEVGASRGGSRRRWGNDAGIRRTDLACMLGELRILVGAYSDPPTGTSGAWANTSLQVICRTGPWDCLGRLHRQRSPLQVVYLLKLPLLTLSFGQNEVPGQTPPTPVSTAALSLLSPSMTPVSPIATQLNLERHSFCQWTFRSGGGWRDSVAR